MKYTTLTLMVLVGAFLIGGLPLLLTSTSVPGVVSEETVPVSVPAPSTVELSAPEDHAPSPSVATPVLHTEPKAATQQAPRSAPQPAPAPAATPAPAPKPATQQAVTPAPAPVATPTADVSGVTVLVDISNFVFSPWKISVKKGTTVTWTNRDSAPHTVTSNTDAFGSDSMGKGATYSYTFNTVGNFPYYCAFHSSMVGAVEVTE